MILSYVACAFIFGFALSYFLTKKGLQLSKEGAKLRGQIEAIQEEKMKYLRDLQKKEEALFKLTAENSTLIESRKASEEKLQSLVEVKENLSKEFENLAHKIFQEKMSTFKKESFENIDSVLKPFKEKLSDFQGTVSKYREDEIKETSGLKTELENILRLNKKLSLDAENLTKALKGDNKRQGNWGEFILEKILEGSGLSEGREYTLQGKNLNLKNAEGAVQRPDVIIHLPGEKHVVIDSKVSLVAYEKTIANMDDVERTLALKDFSLSLKNHIKDLSEKKYHALEKLLTPEFVLLFIPLEGAFALALQESAEIFQYAWDRKIILVSPTTLMVTLRTVDSLWRQEKQSKYSLEIANQAGEIYDKFVAFVSDLEDVRHSIKKANDHVETAFIKLSSGRGNIMNRFEKLKQLGAKTSKELPIQEIEDSEK